MGGDRLDRIIAQLQRYMEKEGYDYLLAAGAEQVFYLSEIETTASACNPVLFAVQPLCPTVVLVPRVGRIAVFTAGTLKQYLEDKQIGGDVFYYPSALFIRYDEGISVPEFYGDSLEDCVRRYVSEFSCSGKKMAGDRAFLSLARYEWRWKDPFESADEILTQCRARKVPEEIRRLRIAAAVSWEAMKTVMETVGQTAGSKKRITERELFYRMRSVIYQNRCQWNYTSLSAGPYSPDIYHQPSDYELRMGDVIRMDIGAVWEGYGSDVARSCFYGKAREEDRRLYQTLCEAQARMLEEVRPGSDLGELFELGSRYIRIHGYPEYRRAGLGHSIGVTTEEPPFISPANRGVPMEENMVFSVETPYYVKDKAGFNVEDMILVTKNGYEVLT